MRLAQLYKAFPCDKALIIQFEFSRKLVVLTAGIPGKEFRSFRLFSFGSDNELSPQGKCASCFII